MANSLNLDVKRPVLSQRMSKMFPFDKRYDANTKCAMDVGKNLFHPENNPKGVINLATAFSYVCEDILAEKFSQGGLYCCDVNERVWHVTQPQGNLGFREVLALFYTRKLKANHPIQAKDLIVTNGVTSTLDYIAHCIADPGDVILIPTPAYAYLYRNIYLRAEIEFWPVDLFKEGESIPFQFTAEKVENSIKDALKEGKNVRGLIIVNPNNPLGEIYSPQLIISILETCKRYGIHVIIDEISSLAVFEEGKQFHSAISYPSLPDPERTHLIWSFSKDFSMDGSRISVVHTRCEALSSSLIQLGYFFFPPTLQQIVFKQLIQDEKWCEETYLPTFLRRLRSAHKLFSKGLTELGLTVLLAASGFVVMVHFGKFMRKNSFAEEDKLFKHILNAGVFITPGHIMYCSQPGWFRICFSHPEAILLKALDRLKSALNDFYETSSN